MGQAIAQRAKFSFCVSVFDKDGARTVNAAGVRVAANYQDVINDSDALILAVKPQDFESMLYEIKAMLTGHLVISIAAGITTEYIENKLGGARVVRVMPNLPAQVGRGVSGVSRGEKANEQDMSLAKQLLECVGIVLELEDENMLDAVTALSGSGPAFYAYALKQGADPDAATHGFVCELTRAAMSFSFDPLKAQRLAKETAEGTSRLMQEYGWTCDELMKRVASKGGTTEAGLKVLENGGSLAEAVDAAFKRAKEMNK